MAHLKTPLAVLGAIAVLVLAGNSVALATTGHSFILGKSNSANAATTLSRTTSGSVLSLHSAYSSNAPLAVNSTGRVTHLNADLLDGLHASSLTSNLRLYTKSFPNTSATSAFQLTVPLPVGKYLVSHTTYMLSFPSAALGEVDCYLRVLPSSGTARYAAETRFTTTSNYAAASATGFITVHTGDTVSLKCSTAAPFYVVDEEPIQVMATPVTTLLSNSTLRTAARSAAR